MNSGWDDETTTWPPVDPDLERDALFPPGTVASPSHWRPHVPPKAAMLLTVLLAFPALRTVADMVVPGLHAIPFAVSVGLGVAAAIFTAALSERLGIMSSGVIAVAGALGFAVFEHAIFALPALILLAGLFIGRVRTTP